MLTFTLKVLRTNAADAKKLPAMHTARHPNLLQRPDTTGPENYKIIKVLIELRVIIAHLQLSTFQIEDFPPTPLCLYPLHSD
jgi:hypothetical protein